MVDVRRHLVVGCLALCLPLGVVTQSASATDNCDYWWIFTFECAIILCIETTQTSVTNCTMFLAGPSIRDCDTDGNGAKCASMSWTQSTAEKYSLSGSLEWEAFGLTASNENDTVTTTTESLSEVTLVCSGCNQVESCCNALWMQGKKTVKTMEGWCELAPPCGDNPGPGNLDCEGDGVLLEITGTGVHADCSYTDPECTTD